MCQLGREICPPEIVGKFELYGPDSSICINGLNGRIIHNNFNKPSSASSSEIHCFLFGLQFFNTTSDQ